MENDSDSLKIKACNYKALGKMVLSESYICLQKNCNEQKWVDGYCRQHFKERWPITYRSRIKRGY